MTCSAGVRPKGCRELALVFFGRAAWPEAMQSAHARAPLPALPWQLMRVTAGSRLVRSEVNMDWMLMPLQWVPSYSLRIVGPVQPRMWSPVCSRARPMLGLQWRIPCPPQPPPLPAIPAAFVSHRVLASCLGLRRSTRASACAWRRRGEGRAGLGWAGLGWAAAQPQLSLLNVPGGALAQ